MSLAYDGKPQKNPSVPISSHFRRILAQVRHFFNDIIFDFVDSFLFLYVKHFSVSGDYCKKSDPIRYWSTGYDLWNYYTRFDWPSECT